MFETALRLVERGVQTGAYPGAAVAVGRGDTVLARGFYGLRQNRGATLPLTEQTLFDAASLSKLIGPTMLALRYLGRGQLGLYDSLDYFFTEKDCPDAALWAVRREIPVFALLTHTSGLTPGVPLYSVCDSPDDAVRAILTSQPVSECGKEVHYSCMGFILLQKILEQIGGAPLDVLVQREVFDVLGMKTACYCPLEKGRTDIAATEWPNPLGKYLCGTVHDENAAFLGGVSGNAGIFVTLDDLIPFAAMLSRRGETPAGRYLAPAVFRAAVTDYTPAGEESRGLGFQLKAPSKVYPGGEVCAPGSYGHTGFTGTSLYVDAASGLWGILLTNAVHPARAGRTAFFSIRRRFYNAIFAEGLPEE